MYPLCCAYPYFLAFFLVRNTEDFIKMLYTYACIDILVYYFRMAYIAFRGISRRCAAPGCCVVAGRAVADHPANTTQQHCLAGVASGPMPVLWDAVPGRPQGPPYNDTALRSGRPL
jgi:hypothetical protein